MIGLGVTGVMVYMFTTENLWQYAVLSAVGAAPRMLLTMIFAQVAVCALLGAELGLGLCAFVGRIAMALVGYPFRIMWFTPLLGTAAVVLVSVVAAALSARPVLKLQPVIVFAGR